MEDLKNQAAVMIKRLQTDIQNLKTEIKNLKLGESATAEDYQISQSQIIAYKKQLDACKKELDKERSNGQVMQDKIDAVQEQMIKLTTEV